MLRIAILDSGVNPRHRQVGPVAGGARIRAGGRRAAAETGSTADWGDEIGHGTAVAAAVCENLPAGGYALLSVRVFGRRLAAPADCLAAGIRWAAESGARIANLSAGIPAGSDPEGEGLVRDAAVEAVEAGLTLIAPRSSRGVSMIPGALPGVPGLIGVEAAADLERGVLVRRGPVLVASPWARPLPPLPREKNFSGVSFAVAAVTNAAARLLLSGKPLSPKARPSELCAALLALGEGS